VKEIIMKSALFCICLLGIAASPSRADENQTSNLRQYYSGKFGFYQPSDGLNNGLMFGVDGITEFIHYNFFLGGAIDVYAKQTFSFYKNSPDIRRQAIILLPIHVNVGYEIFDLSDADSRVYVGTGLGYYLYFYSVEYRTTTGGIFPTGTLRTESKSDGNIFGTIFARLLIGKVFVEPRLYFASKVEDTVSGGYSFVVNPTGFGVTLGFQY
jgi:hypothetical protein